MQERRGEKGDFGDKNYAIFKIKGGKADVTSDIVSYGLMNQSKSERKVILKKVDGENTPLSGAKFEIYNYDMTPRETTGASEANGIAWVGTLPESKPGMTKRAKLQLPRFA